MNYRQKIYASYLTSREQPLQATVNLKSATVWYQKVILPVLPTDRNSQILELGCGPGYFLHLLQKQGYQHLSGVDLGTEQLERAALLGVQELIVCQDVFTFLRNTHETYHLICAFDLLEHFTKDELLELLALIYQHLKPQARLLFRCPNGAGLFGARLRYADITHELAFTRNSMAQLLKSVGFARCDCYAVKPVIHGLKSLLRRLIFEVLAQIGQLYLAAETGQLGGHIITQNLWGQAWKAVETCKKEN